MGKAHQFALACLWVALISGCQDSKTTSAGAQKKVKPEICEVEDSASTASYGAPMKLKAADTVAVQTLLADPAAYDGKYVRVAGTVDKVCPKKGCWLQLHDAKANESLFVKFPDPAEGRLIPLDAVGKPVVVEGTVKVKEISEALARHYKQDAGAPQAEIEKINGPQKQISITNGSAQIAGIDPK